MEVLFETDLAAGLPVFLEASQLVKTGPRDSTSVTHRTLTLGHNFSTAPPSPNKAGNPALGWHESANIVPAGHTRPTFLYRVL